ncbi:16766_t:CDS:1 [Cetraspora pellucida]|uniref:16766_t:CDS:1 n=1 Tax=Cetraspora pellucida TaxID=1433469 RepID=A0A9N9NKQ9_9GLOM|nr:16766_t:CDS:1 [Cetraspora pellucida]
MSLIKNYNSAQYKLEHFTYNTEHKSQPLASITSSINNNKDPATSSRKRCSKLFLERLFEEKDFSLKHPKTHTHREIVCFVCFEDKKKHGYAKMMIPIQQIFGVILNTTIQTVIQDQKKNHLNLHN